MSAAGVSLELVADMLGHTARGWVSVQVADRGEPTRAETKLLLGVTEVLCRSGAVRPPRGSGILSLVSGSPAEGVGASLLSRAMP
jgi:hypothetical protein